MESRFAGFIKGYKKEEMREHVNEILARNKSNTYVISCYADKDSLYKQMREDIKTLCEYTELNQ